MDMTRKFATRGSMALALCLSFSLLQTSAVFGQTPAGTAPQAGPNRAPDPRVQQRKYHFADTNEELPYALFVSSKVAKDKKAPLIVALHGVFGDGNALLRGNTLDLAEEGGYIVVGPMGYNPQGWFGSPVIVMNGGPGRGRGAAPAGRDGGADAGRGGGAGAGRGGAQPTPEPPNLAELSEKDVMNVLAIVRKEFNIDDKRTYLMGHSMGGAGALFLGPKYVDQWAAVAAMAPAAFRMDPESSLAPVKDKMPLLLAHGDADMVVSIDVGRRWAKTATELKMKDFKYLELPGADHGTVIMQSMPEIFKFFKERTR
jgi:poly(3-hydroxybutyrate) depolymerase